MTTNIDINRVLALISPPPYAGPIDPAATAATLGTTPELVTHALTALEAANLIVVLTPSDPSAPVLYRRAATAA